MKDRQENGIPHDAVVELVRRCYSDERIDGTRASARRDVVREHLDRVAAEYGLDGSILGKATAAYVMERSINPEWFVDNPNERRRPTGRGVNEHGGMDFPSMTYASTVESGEFKHEIGVMRGNFHDTWKVVEHVIPLPEGGGDDYWQRFDYPTLEHAWEAYLELCEARSPGRAPSM